MAITFDDENLIKIWSNGSYCVWENCLQLRLAVVKFLSFTDGYFVRHNIYPLRFIIMASMGLGSNAALTQTTSKDPGDLLGFKNSD